jgi:ankyrin repeat protein
LHLAASEGKFDAVKFLVEEAGCTVNIRDRFNGTPLLDATEHGYTDIAEYLRSKGARDGHDGMKQAKYVIGGALVPLSLSLSLSLSPPLCVDRDGGLSVNVSGKRRGRKLKRWDSHMESSMLLSIRASMIARSLALSRALSL